MKKNAPYFKHDANASSDPKLLRLICAEKAKGYGLYWLLLETLRLQPDFRFPLEGVGPLAYRFETKPAVLLRIINDYGLFCVEKDSFYSPGMENRLGGFIKYIQGEDGGNTSEHDSHSQNNAEGDCLSSQGIAGRGRLPLQSNAERDNSYSQDNLRKAATYFRKDAETGSRESGATDSAADKNGADSGSGKQEEAAGTPFATDGKTDEKNQNFRQSQTNLTRTGDYLPPHLLANSLKTKLESAPNAGVPDQTIPEERIFTHKREGVREILSMDEALARLPFEQIWCEDMARRSKRGPGFMEELPRMLPYFACYIRLRGEEYTIGNLSDAKRRFLYWMQSDDGRLALKQLDKAPDAADNLYRFEILVDGQRTYLGRVIPSDAPPRPDAVSVWDEKRKKWVH